MPLADANRWRAAWGPLRRPSSSAIEVAEELGDVERLGVCSLGDDLGALWQSAAHGESTPDEVSPRSAASLAGLPEPTASSDAG